MKAKDMFVSASKWMGADTIFSLAARNHPRIFMYHRVAKVKGSRGMPREIFSMQVKSIKKHFRVVTLGELVSAYRSGRDISRMAVITFDDGYEDYKSVAYPILKKEGCSSTLFVTTGFIEGSMWFWPDKVKYCFDSSCRKSVTLGDVTYELEGDESRFSAWDKLTCDWLYLDDESREKNLLCLAEASALEIPHAPPSAFNSNTTLAFDLLFGPGKNANYKTRYRGDISRFITIIAFKTWKGLFAYSLNKLIKKLLLTARKLSNR